MFFKSRRRKEIDRIAKLTEAIGRKIEDGTINSGELFQEELARLTPTDALVVETAVRRLYGSQAFYIAPRDPSDMEALASAIREAGIDPGEPVDMPTPPEKPVKFLINPSDPEQVQWLKEQLFNLRDEEESDQPAGKR